MAQRNSALIVTGLWLGIFCSTAWSATDAYSLSGPSDSVGQQSQDQPPSEPLPKSRILASTVVVKTPNNWGNLFGFGYLNYESDSFAIGGIVHSGQLTFGTTGSYTEGGLLALFSYDISRKMDFLFELMIGGGGGNSSTVGGGLVIHPSIGLDVGLGKATRFVFTVGYSWLPTTTTFSGLTGNVRIDFLQF